MVNFNISNQPSGQTAQCEVCCCEITHQTDFNHASTVCQNFECKQLYNQRFTMNPTLYKPHFEFRKKLILERKAKEEHDKRHADSIDAHEALDNQKILDAYINTDKSIPPEQIKLVMIPTGLAHTVPLSSARKAQYQKHLEETIEEAVQYSNADDAVRDQHYDAHERLKQQDEFLQSHPHISAASDTLCGLCKGGCCSTGGDHGFISAVTIRRLMDKDPDLTAQSILNSYLSHIPDHSIDHSCINQTESGCALPKAMRSDVCNVYFCDEVKSHQTRMAENDSEKGVTLVIQRSNTNWNRYEAIDFNKVVSITLINGENRLDIKP
ncbi:hypothetical protein Kalk_01235 [Ketobacter alkanivorans]|uniref:Uncharacterized protein n=2 Tax=Ketobacter alkanivorans TaxID=1917421 RepID=A0A2K9LFJ2_9GAMM|nr:hypothetical protein Kalk_01235 [Ketobacter alkanivorans]